MKNCPGIAPLVAQDGYLENKYSKNTFNRVFEKCLESGMIAGHTQAIDGAFLKANASKTILK